VFDGVVDAVLKEICFDIEKRSLINVLEIGADKNHVHFLIQCVRTYRVTKIVIILKSLTARKVYMRCPQVN
jgi:putative transposase